MKLRWIENIVKFNNKSRPRSKEDKKKDTYENAHALYKALNAFKIGIFPTKATQVEGLKLLTPKQMLQITDSSCTSKDKENI